jgi:hypothetical protein
MNPFTCFSILPACPPGNIASGTRRGGSVAIHGSPLVSLVGFANARMPS